MSTLTVNDVPLAADTPAQRLRRTAAAVRVSLHWWGTHRALTGEQKEQFGAAAGADSRLLTAGKRLIDTGHEAFRRLGSVRTRIKRYWRDTTLPYVTPGVRLIRQGDIEKFVHTLEGFREELARAAAGLNAVYAQVQADARQRLGPLYDPDDYPDDVRSLFGVEWDFPSVEPPSYLMQVAPEVYQEECRRVAARFDEAVRLAEQAFAAEFARRLSHLADRLANGEDGQWQVFRDSAVNNLLEFFGRFQDLNLRSSPELDALVEQAQRLVRSHTPQEIRGRDALRQHIAGEVGRINARVETLLTDAPRRRLVRARPSGNGGGHATAH